MLAGHRHVVFADKHSVDSCMGVDAWLSPNIFALRIVVINVFV